MKYTFWYKKDIEAKNPREAVKAESKAKYKFCSMEIEEDDGEERTPAVGFVDVGDDIDG